MLQSSRRTTDVEVNEGFFWLRKAYDVEDKESLRLFMLKYGTYGVEDDDKLHECYWGI